MTAKEIDTIQQKYQDKLDKFNEQYYIDGTGSLKTRHSYEDIIEICRLAKNYLSETCSRCEHTWRNAQAKADEYKKLKENGFESVITADKVISDILSLPYSV